MSTRVKATRLGYYGHKRRKEGEEFELDRDSDFSDTWMKRVDEAGNDIAGGGAKKSHKKKTSTSGSTATAKPAPSTAKPVDPSSDEDSEEDVEESEEDGDVL